MKHLRFYFFISLLITGINANSQENEGDKCVNKELQLEQPTNLPEDVYQEKEVGIKSQVDK
ncbi:MAG: hypothetical protein ACI857_002861 [Arenicella sp.]|jgi:hypothetical protein